VTSDPWFGEKRGDWLREVTDWLRKVVMSRHLGWIVDVTSVRERPWGAVLRVTTSNRVLYFKAGGLGAQHEAPVLAALARIPPDLGPVVVEADESRSWLLLVDHGRPMWDVMDTAGQVLTLEHLLPRYARLQASSAQSVEVWLEAGAPDHRVRGLPALLASLLAGEMPGGALPLDAKLRRAIDTVLPHFAQVCEELASSSCADALDHGDLHGGNVLLDGGGIRLVDWGDSIVTHPFCSLFVTYELAVSRFGRAERAGAALRLRDAYLDAWSRDGSIAALRDTFTLAVWVGYVNRALDFAHMLEGAGVGMINTWHPHIVRLLRHWVDAHALLDQGEQFLCNIEP